MSSVFFSFYLSNTGIWIDYCIILSLSILSLLCWLMTWSKFNTSPPPCKLALGYIIAKKWSTVELCCTFNQWFLHIIAVGGLCFPTTECSKGGELLASGQLSKSSPNHHHTYPTHIQKTQTLPAIHCCTPLFTKQNAFCSTSVIGVLGPVWRQAPKHLTAPLFCL